jgi:UDP-glucose 6-dehydrogenase
MAEMGHHVVGVDIDPGKVAKLAAGEVPFYEPGLAEVLRNNISRGRLQSSPMFTSSASGLRRRRVSTAPICAMCTPSSMHSRPD